MPVYVDNMKAKYGRMIMCHMSADTLEELHEMADKIGIQRKWFQEPPKTSAPHYDISISKRNLAIELGAQSISMKLTVLYTSKLLVEWCETNRPEALENAKSRLKYFKDRLL